MKGFKGDGPVRMCTEGLEHGRWYFWADDLKDPLATAGPYSSEAYARKKLEEYRAVGKEKFIINMDTAKEQAVLDILWDRKGKHQDTFAYAELKEDTSMSVWNGEDSSKEKNHVKHMAKAGATVLITMLSRFGDVGIRDERINTPSNGYWARVLPDMLTNLRLEK